MLRYKSAFSNLSECCSEQAEGDSLLSPPHYNERDANSKRYNVEAAVVADCDDVNSSSGDNSITTMAMRKLIDEISNKLIIA